LSRDRQTLTNESVVVFDSNSRAFKFQILFKTIGNMTTVDLRMTFNCALQINPMTSEYNIILALGKQKKKLCYFISYYKRVNSMTSHFEEKQIQGSRE
jgi:hypothetical protein